jgi:hypothetical protein
MNRIFIAALLLPLAPLSHAEPAAERLATPVAEPVVHAPTRAPRAWLGLQISKPDETVTAHVPSLPPGVGFLVKSLDENGPAVAAGLRELDLISRIGDQMLVNEAQLATLLRLSAPGEEIVISGFRGGKPLEVTLKLGEAPALARPFPGEMVESAILPGACEGPMRVVNLAEKSASFSSDDGHAVVRRSGEVYLLNIVASNDEVIFDGEISSANSLENVPKDWHRRIRVLCRTLDQALAGGMPAQRQPRPRVVPPTTPRPLK